jgi:hypothetical protein
VKGSCPRPLLPAADVFIGRSGPKLRYEAEAHGRRQGSRGSSSTTRPVLEFALPDGTALTATSQQDLDEKIERYVREQDDCCDQIGVP